MNKNLISGSVAIVGIFCLMIVAYGHSFQVENLFNEGTHRDIQSFTQELTQTGMAPAQVKVFRSVLLDLNHNLLNDISSEVSTLVNVFSTMGIIIIILILALTERLTSKKREDADPS